MSLELRLLDRKYPQDVSDAFFLPIFRRQSNSIIAFQLVTGRVWKGCAFGGIKGRSQLPDLVDDYLQGKLKVDEFITHRKNLDGINEAFETMKQGDCIRCVVDMRAV